MLPSRLSLLLDGQLGEFTIDCLTHYLEVLKKETAKTVYRINGSVEEAKLPPFHYTQLHA
jgi:hypothetical protein